ncbi:MAG TPA: methyltransferase domain-containing protein [Rhizomicrobium sp.]|nr:methyltransferase domain-containing protein [Rhizomicrobium sp.]
MIAGQICKCCGGTAAFFRQYDLARTCEDRKNSVFPASGVPVPYFRCGQCGFIFATYYDGWSSDEMARRIYNSDYILADPDITEKRPQYLAGVLSAMASPTWDILDYGGGAGKFAEELRKHGFQRIQYYDPYFSSGERPKRQFYLVTAFEVVEHAIDPRASFADALSYVAPGGAFLFTTSLQPRRLDPDWWYIAPRNGHVSIHTFSSLDRMAAALGVQWLSLSNALHLFYRTSESPVVHRLTKGKRRAALYAASQLGIGPLLSTAKQFSGLGFGIEASDPRHIARALLHSIT